MTGKVGRTFFATLSVELDEVRARKCNSERLIMFQSVFLQRVQGVNNSKHICAHIMCKLSLWNREAFDELVNDTFNVARVLYPLILQG